MLALEKADDKSAVEKLIADVSINLLYLFYR